ncbi:hypothetical protein VNI00_000997 [Paramarasmius palmivorus]|uniref:Uncharacterized protein n=1 Tax=Paramarasmius palmivorus TaxID=297713 RepID=A0AAW0E8U0_9AGAR
MDSHTATSRRKSRPPLTKHDTDQLLSYYHSPLADKPSSSSRPLAHRKQSTGSTSSSDYSASGDTASDYSNKDDGTTPVRRTSIPSRGAADRRRLAIVEMEPTSTITTKKTTGMNNDNLRSRRGVEASLGSLALVAPPDAAPATYTHLTPPSTAPVDTNTTNNTHSSSSNSFSRSASSDERRDVDSKAHGHQRSASEAITSNNKSSPRDVGIVGTQRAPLLVETTKLEPLDEKALQPPVFIHPQSRSPSPYTPSSSSPQKELSSPALPPMKRRSTGQSIITPDIGDEKSIDIPVASPVVVKLASNEIPQSAPSLSRPKGTLTPAPQINVVPNSPTTVFMPEVPSSYLHYQPGIHSTAGPLPPPPRASFNIDAASPPPPRPPRLRSPSPTRRDQLKQSLQLPPSVNAALSRKSTKSPNSSQTDLTRSIPSVDDTAPASTSSPDVPSPINLESPPTSQMQPKEVTISVHKREGAFAPSTILSSSPSLSTSESASVPIPIPKTDTETA